MLPHGERGDVNGGGDAPRTWTNDWMEGFPIAVGCLESCNFGVELWRRLRKDGWDDACFLDPLARSPKRGEANGIMPLCDSLGGSM